MRMRHPPRETISLSLAAVSCVIMAIAVAVTVVVYNGANEMDYSPFNHLYSELGWAKHSPAAGLFNFGLCVSSILNAPLFWLLGERLKGGLGRATAVMGVFCCWACYCVGLIPLGPSPMYLTYNGGRVGLHFFVALVFFWAWVVTMALCLIALLRSAARRELIWLVVATALALVAALTFLAVPNERIISQLAKGIVKVRADFYWTATLEWSVVGTIGLWLLAAIHVLWNQRATGDESR